mmetsp:Transcript_7710/g.14536  ORF Transcript_7710/g.14536 Transcript_7710/m.14536 type:complete len:2032 (+) Transcript_7710:158-6253(+)
MNSGEAKHGNHDDMNTHSTSNSNSNSNSSNNKENESSFFLNLSHSHYTSASATASAYKPHSTKLHHGQSHNARRSTFSSDAASSYYFSQVPKTPAVKSARKKYKSAQKKMNMTSLSSSTSFLNISRNDIEPAVVPPMMNLCNASTSSPPTMDLQELQQDIEREHARDLLRGHDDSQDTSMLLSDLNTTGTSSACSISDDNLNKSVLSDTTELTASIFVFCEKSRRMKLNQLELQRRDIQRLASDKKPLESAQHEQQQQSLAQGEKDEKEKCVDKEVVEEVLQETVNIPMSQSSEEELDTQSNRSQNVDNDQDDVVDDDDDDDDDDDSNNTERMGNLLHFHDDDILENDDEEVEDLREGCISRSSESSIVETVNHINRHSESIEYFEMDQQDQHQHPAIREDDSNMDENIQNDEIEKVSHDSAKQGNSPAKDQSPAVPEFRPSLDVGSSILLSNASPLPMPTSLPRNRRYSYIPESNARFTLFGSSPQTLSSSFHKETESVKKLTASIQKARMMRESQRRDKSKRNRFSLPSRFHSTLPIDISENDGATTNNVQQSSISTQKTVDCLNATFDETNHGSGLNQILGDLVANNNELNETMEHATPEKLNLSDSQDVPSSPPNGRKSNTDASSMVFKSPQFKRLSLGKPEREPLASPALNTRSKKRSSVDGGDSETFLSLPMVKRSDKKSTPNRLSKSFEGRDMEGEDNTEMIMQYLVPRIDMDDSQRSEVTTRINQSNAHMAKDVQSESSSSPIGYDQAHGGTVMEYGTTDNFENDSSHGNETSEFSPTVDPSQGTASSESSTLVLSYTSSESTSWSPQRMDVSDPDRDHSGTKDKDRLVDDNSSIQSGEGKIVENSSSLKRTRSTDLRRPDEDNHHLYDIEGDESDSSTDTDALLEDSVDHLREMSKSAELLLHSVLTSSTNEETRMPSAAKARKLDALRPLSGCGNEDDDSESDSSESYFADDMSSKMDGDEGNTIGTVALRKIMSDLQDEFMSSSKMESKNKRRRSSVFSTSSFSEDGTSGSDHISRRAELFTANTQDLKGLLSDFTSRGSSLMPINESMCSVSTSISPLNKDGEVSPTSRTNTRTPKSILKKKGRESTPKRNVAFGPPVAAEYNIGSPAKNFTPLCSQTTKKLFSIPHLDKDTSSVYENSNISKDSKELYSMHDSYQDTDDDDLSNESNVNNDQTEGVTVALETDLGKMLDTITGTDRSKISETSLDESVAEFSENSRIGGGDTMTMGLEGDMKQLLETYSNQNELRKHASPTPKQVHQLDELCCAEETVRLESNIADVLNIQDGATGRSSYSDLDQSTISPIPNGTKTKSPNGSRNQLIDSIHSSQQKACGTRTLSTSNEENHFELEDTCDIKHDAQYYSKSLGTLNGNTKSQDGKDLFQTVDLENDLQGMIGEMDRLQSERQSAAGNNEDTISLTNVSYLHKPDEDTVGYEYEYKRDQVNVLNSDCSDQNDYSYTMQLEDKIESMIDAVRREDPIEEYESNDKQLVDVVETSVVSCLPNGRRRSRRFSLVRSTDISNEMTGDVFINGNVDTFIHVMSSSTKCDRSAKEHCVKEISSISDHFRWEGLSLRWGDMSQYFVHIEEGRYLESTFSFLLDGARSLLAEFSHPLIVDKVSTFLSEVCVLIENSDHITDPDALLTKHLELKLNIYGRLKEALEGKSSHGSMISHVNLLKEVDSLAFDTELHEFSEWEIQVVSTLCSKVEEVNFDVEDDEQSIQRQINLSNDIHQTLSILSSQIVKNARKENIRRKKDEVEELQIEISSLETDIQEAEQNLLRIMTEGKDVENLTEIIKEKESLSIDLSRDRSFIDINLEAITSLEGLQSWTLIQVEENLVDIEFIGDSSELSLYLSFNLLQNGEVICKVRDMMSTVQSTKRTKYTSNVKAFFSHQVWNLRKSLSKRPLAGISEICSIMHHVDWYLGRLQIIGTELSMLEARYDGLLKRASSSDIFHFELSIINNASGKVLNTIFEIGETYPFASEAIISGDEDIIGLETHLTKNAKPGYGYLSRTCDIISSFKGR